MGSDEPEHGTGMDRAEILSRFQPIFECLDWLNTQVKEHMLAPFHLTVPQVTVLMILSREETALEMSSIASQSGLPPGTVTSVMDRLQLRQLARRREDPGNGRHITAAITGEGREILRALDDRRMRLFEELMSSYSDHELQQLLDLCYRWIDVAGRTVNADDH